MIDSEKNHKINEEPDLSGWNFGDDYTKLLDSGNFWEEDPSQKIADQCKSLGIPDEMMKYYNPEAPYDLEADGFNYFVSSWEASQFIGELMPQDRSGIGEAVTVALQKKLLDQMTYVGERLNRADISQDEEKRLLQGQRDLSFALRSIISSLYRDFDGGPLVNYSNYGQYNTYVYYNYGVKSRDGGFESSYTVCNDDMSYDEDDHDAQIDNIDDDRWPGEFHYDAKLDIKVNPLKRIEFVYTPEAESGKKRHSSHSQYAGDREYNNESLSIRIDLDTEAPDGIALDIGRSSYDGPKRSTRLTRSSDLLGDIFENASPNGSHEFTGFKPGMANMFKGFAEGLSLRLALQKQEFINSKRDYDQKEKLNRQRAIGAAAIRDEVASRIYI